MAVDPVCKMLLLDEKAAFSSEHKDATYYFCGKGCKDRFEADPDKYLSGKPVDWITGQ